MELLFPDMRIKNKVHWETFYNMKVLLQLFLYAHLEMYLTTAIWKTNVQLTQCSTIGVKKVKSYHALNYLKMFQLTYYWPNKI